MSEPIAVLRAAARKAGDLWELEIVSGAVADGSPPSVLERRAWEALAEYAGVVRRPGSRLSPAARGRPETRTRGAGATYAPRPEVLGPTRPGVTSQPTFTDRQVTPAERRRAAYHEAGHAVVGVLVGMPPLSVEIYPFFTTNMDYGHTHPDPAHALPVESDPIAWIAMLSAGAVGETKLAGPGRYAGPASLNHNLGFEKPSSDGSLIRGLIEQRHGAMDEYEILRHPWFVAGVVRASSLLNQNTPGFLRVAEQLLRDGTMSAAAVRSALGV